MIHDEKLLVFLWVEAYSTIVYVENENPHKILGDKTSKEPFTRVKLEIGHFQVFGCPIYIHVLLRKRMKLEPSGKKEIFVEYNETSKPYRIFIPSHKGRGL